MSNQEPPAIPRPLLDPFTEIGQAVARIERREVRP